MLIITLLFVSYISLSIWMSKHYFVLNYILAFLNNLWVIFTGFLSFICPLSLGNPQRCPFPSKSPPLYSHHQDEVTPQQSLTLLHAQQLTGPWEPPAPLFLFLASRLDVQASGSSNHLLVQLKHSLYVPTADRLPFLPTHCPTTSLLFSKGFT